MDIILVMDSLKRKGGKVVGKNVKKRRTHHSKICMTENHNIIIFPSEIWILIFSFLSCRFLNGVVNQVCKNFYSLVDDPYLWSLVPLDISYKTQISGAITNSIALISLIKKPKYSNLRELYIGKTSIGEKTLKIIVEKCPNLKKLVMETDGLTEDKLLQLKGSSVKELTIESIKYKKYNYNAFVCFSNLEKLVINRLEGVDYFLTIITGSCTQLTTLELGTTFSDNNLMLLTKLKTLERLTIIPHTYGTSEDVLITVCGKLENLMRLNIINCYYVSDNFIANLLKHCKKLKILELTCPPHYIRGTLSKQTFSHLLSSDIRAVNIPICNSPSLFGLLIPYEKRIAVVEKTYQFLAAAHLQLLDAIFHINYTTKRMVRPSENISDTIKYKDSHSYTKLLEILFLVQRFEESLFQNSCSEKSYMEKLMKKLSDLEITLEKRKLFYMYRDKSKLEYQSTIKFIDDYLMLWFLGQTEPTIKGQW
jgi:hypothetical protein